MMVLDTVNLESTEMSDKFTAIDPAEVDVFLAGSYWWIIN